VELPSLVLLAALIFAAAALYTSVGHAGASGYIAAMALMGVSAGVMKPTALTLNILVAGFASLRWTRNGKDLDWRSLLPLVIASVPAAFIGGAYQLSQGTYRLLVGAILLAAAIKLLLRPNGESYECANKVHVPWLPGFLTGAGIGLLSGLTGTGGGIFLTPLLLFLGWAAPRQASGLTAPFILLNSVAAMVGNVAALRSLPPELPCLVLAALAGAVLGTQAGINWTSTAMLQRFLGVVLLIAAGKFLLI
jgi:uncharacterized membrane protein YfcA